MRVSILAAMLLTSSSLCAFAQEQGRAPAGAPQAGVPAQTEQNSAPPPDQQAGRDQQKTDDREMGPDWRLRHSDRDRMGRDDRERRDGDRISRDDREMERGGMMRRGDGDRMDRDREKERGRYQERGDRDWDRADRARDYGWYSDADRPRRRVKICVEYDNGEEYCRYRR
jgi:hypothetical protein